ncbi:dihydroorotase [Pontibacillus yanchengensis]|uniref:Dihydroorotase n=1 Tax=Pontibacillus yanchengensis TaxID=462910 RepID=A0ACC7VBH3_9BACI|nr:dihydroorotase [Pontibacillus yanchengensis]MYL52077.1 dihydroorotase [Pontibacillus yanchengensis]
MSLLLKNVQLFEKEELVTRHIYIDQGVIQQITTEEKEAEEEVDCSGLVVSPGFVDIHVHLREPGATDKETIATGSEAAAKGGFTTICAMPNTRPVPDNAENLQYVQKLIQEHSVVNVLPYASITERQVGQQLTPMNQLKEMGAVSFTDDGVGVQSADQMLKAMERANAINASIVAHCEDNSLIHGGVIHEGHTSKELGIPGIPSVCESVQIARDVLLAEATGCHYHVCHVSTKESVRVIRDAKRAGIPVTAEVTPHHLLLTENDITENNGMFKMNPPLRSVEDRKALREGLLDGTIDCIATDHAPHTEDEKQQGLVKSPFGIVGHETAFSLLYTNLVLEGVCSLKQLLDWLTITPANVFGLTAGELKEEQAASLVLLDLNHTYQINRHEFVSKGKNTPFHGWTVTGAPKMTLLNGKIVWKEEFSYGKA